MFHSIDSRDLAIAIWLVIFFTWCATKPEVRKSLGNFLAILASRPIFISIFLAAGYISIVTYALEALNCWTFYQLKITIFWFTAAGMPALMDTPKISRNPSMLRTAFLKNFKLSLLLDFFVNLFRFPIVGELIFVPLTAILGGLIAVAQSDEKYVPARKFINIIVAILGFGLFCYEIFKLATAFDTIANINTLRNFVLPILFNIAFIPILWGMSIYAAYESAFCRLQFLIKDKELQSYTKCRLILRFRANTSALNSWFDAAWSCSFDSQNDIDQSIAAIMRSNNVA
jgi:hypothetical protein